MLSATIARAAAAENLIKEVQRGFTVEQIWIHFRIPLVRVKITRSSET